MKTEKELKAFHNRLVDIDVRVQRLAELDPDQLIDAPIPITYLFKIPFIGTKVANAVRRIGPTLVWIIDDPALKDRIQKECEDTPEAVSLDALCQHLEDQLSSIEETLTKVGIDLPAIDEAKVNEGRPFPLET